MLFHRGVAKAFLIVIVAPVARADYPDFDLEISCPPRLSGTPGGTIRFPARVYLRTTPGETKVPPGNPPPEPQGARAWSLSLAAGQGARIVAADSSKGAGALVPTGRRRQDGYESTELTAGDGNEGAVSAVILSLTADVYLPGSGREALLDIVIESIVPLSGCADASVGFVDGRKGSGQPVKNTITYGVDSASTRRDDGGPLDNDMDMYEPCRFSSCAGPYFLRGDVTGNLQVDLSDAVKVLDHLFRAATPPLCLRAADVDADGSVNVSDAIFLMNHLFLGGASPASPYPNCGLVSTPSALPCDAAQFCP